MRYQLRHYPRLVRSTATRYNSSDASGKNSWSRVEGRTSHCRSEADRIDTCAHNWGMTHISRRSAAISPSATLAVAATAKALAAQGKPVISFATGEPDFPTAPHIVEAAQRAAADPANHKYTATGGLPEFREAIAAAEQRDAGLTLDPDCIVVTNGGKQADFETWAAILDPGDEVLLPSPFWTTYPEAIRFFGGLPVDVPAGADSGFKVNVAQLEAARTDRTVALLLCSPSNPSGAVYTADELREIGEWALSHHLMVVSDEIYGRLTYTNGGAPAPSILAVVPELADSCIILNGLAKSYAMTGWRVGWLAAPAPVAAAVRKVQSHLSSNVNNIAQRAGIAALTGPQAPVAAMQQAFARRRRRALEILGDVPGLVVPEPAGAFYVFADVHGLLGRTIRRRRATTSAELATILLEEAYVATVPGEAFGAPGNIRFSYALSDDALDEGLQRVARLLAE